MAVLSVPEKRAGEKKPTRYYSTKQEKHVAEALGGKRTSNSGATALGGKADVDVGRVLSVECKTKTKPSESITIKKEWLEKLRQTTLIDGTIYHVLAFSFGPDEPSWYVIDEKTAELFCEWLVQQNASSED